MSTTAEKIAVMQAYDRGERVQMQTAGADGPWFDIDISLWNWRDCDYRIIPRKVECWAVIDRSGHFIDAYLTKEHAMTCSHGKDRRVIKMREVTE